MEEDRYCPNCGVSFTPSTGKQRWCCRRCRDAYQHRARRRIAKCTDPQGRESLRVAFYNDRIKIDVFTSVRKQHPILFDYREEKSFIEDEHPSFRVPLHGRGVGHSVVLDDIANNRAFLNEKIYLDHYGYPFIVAEDGRMAHLHHLVKGYPPKGQVVDHINNDRLDCRLSNLRFISKGHNNFNKRALRDDNTSGHTGVYYDGRKWYARISYKGETYQLGSYESFEEAVRARRRAELEVYGENPHFSEGKRSRYGGR